MLRVISILATVIFLGIVAVGLITLALLSVMAIQDLWNDIFDK